MNHGELLDRLTGDVHSGNVGDSGNGGGGNTARSGTREGVDSIDGGD